MSKRLTPKVPKLPLAPSNLGSLERVGATTGVPAGFPTPWATGGVAMPLLTGVWLWLCAGVVIVAGGERRAEKFSRAVAHERRAKDVVAGCGCAKLGIQLLRSDSHLLSAQGIRHDRVAVALDLSHTPPRAHGLPSVPSYDFRPRLALWR